MNFRALLPLLLSTPLGVASSPDISARELDGLPDPIWWRASQALNTTWSCSLKPVTAEDERTNSWGPLDQGGNARLGLWSDCNKMVSELQNIPDKYYIMRGFWGPQHTRLHQTGACTLAVYVQLPIPGRTWQLEKDILFDFVRQSVQLKAVSGTPAEGTVMGFWGRADCIPVDEGRNILLTLSGW